VVKKIGPVYDTIRDASYTAEVTLVDVSWSSGTQFNKPKSGYTRAIVKVAVKNLGPGMIHYMGRGFFQALDAQGALHDDSYASETDDCELETVDLIANGMAEGCMAFDVPASGRAELVYAPYQYEALKAGRYLAWLLRP
jgi:hypothetical protein